MLEFLKRKIYLSQIQAFRGDVEIADIIGSIGCCGAYTATIKRNRGLTFFNYNFSNLHKLYLSF